MLGHAHTRLIRTRLPREQLTSRYLATIRIDKFGGFAGAKCGFPKRLNSRTGRPAIVPQKNKDLTLDYTPGCNFFERSEAEANWAHRKDFRPQRRCHLCSAVNSLAETAAK